MPEQEHYTWQGEVVHQEIEEPNVAVLRPAQQGRGWEVTIGNVDLPAVISNGSLYIQAPLPLIFKAFAEGISDVICDLEVRVSGTWGSTLSLDSDGRPIPRTPMVEPRVVRRSRVRR